MLPLRGDERVVIRKNSVEPESMQCYNVSKPNRILLILKADGVFSSHSLPDERVGVRHSTAILGCVLRLSQRIAVIWRQAKH